MRLESLLLGGVAAITLACGSRQLDEGEGEPADPIDWSPCVSQDQFETCAEVCAASGMECVPDGCPADPEFCSPNSCEMATRVMGLGEGICTDPGSGAYVSVACEEPIDWIFNDTARCCCEG